MGNTVITGTQGLEMLQLLSEGIPMQPVGAAEQEQQLPKESFASVIEQIPQEDLGLVKEEAHSILQGTGLSGEDLLEESEVPALLESILSPFQNERVLFKERPAVARESSAIRSDPVILKDSPVNPVRPEEPSDPVLKVLSKELPAEDIKLYIPQAPMVERQEEVVVAPKALKPELPDQLRMPESKSENSAVEKITFTPGAQVEAKAEAVPKLTEMLQEAVAETPVKEEVMRAVVAKVDTTTQQEAFIAKPQEESIAEKTSVEFIEREKTNSVNDLSLRETKSETFTEQDKPIEVITKAETVTSQTVVAEKADAAKLTPQLIQAKSPQIMHEVAVHMKQAIHTSSDKITVQLNPSALGKIHVELQFAQDGRVHAILMADKLETYDLLQRNPQMLKESLAGAGISPDSTDLSFSYRGDDSQKQHAEAQAQTGTSAMGGPINTETEIYRQSSALNSDKQVDIHA